MITKVEPPSLKIYRSSAGSGKTFTLVKEYLNIIFSSDNDYIFKEILAITFTNKAANEMKDRIINTLESLRSGNQELAIVYAKETGLNINQLKIKAGKVLSNILHQYSDFSVFTIDKFTHKLIRSFSQELGLTINFNVELNEKSFLEDCVSELLANIGEDEDLTKYLYDFVDQSIDDSVKTNIASQLSNFEQLIFKGNRDENLKDFKHIQLEKFSEIRDVLFKEVLKISKKLIEIGKDCIDEMYTNKVLPDHLYYRAKRFPKIYNTLINSIPFDIDDVEKWKRWLDEDKWLGSKLDSNTLTKVESVIPFLRENTSLIIEYSQRLIYLREILKHLTGYSLINQLVNEVEKHKKEKGVLLISDFNRLISKIIQNEPAAFVFERIGNKYKHFLFDEFQDTSVRQWNNLVPLVHESLSRGGSNLLVGDAKQAIYRWREGDVDQFLKLPKISSDLPFSKDINMLFSKYYKSHELTVNWRSLPEVVSFNNWIFSNLVTKISSNIISDAYKGLTQQVSRVGSGFVECYICKAEGNIREEKLNYLLDVISRCLANGFSFKDIAIIIRKNKEGTEVAQFLQKHNYPVISGDSIVLSSSTDVSLIINIFKAIEFNNEQSKVIVLKILSKDILTHSFDEYNDESSHYKCKIDIYRFFLESYPIFIKKTYSELELIDKFYYLISCFNINQYNPHVDQFLDLLHNYIQKNGASTLGFLNYYEEESNKTAVDIGSNNAMQIITVHKSKGLQFPVVIMPFGSWNDKEKSNSDYTWINGGDLKKIGLNSFVTSMDEKGMKRIQREAAFLEEKDKLALDNLNLYYVAFTRAEDRFYVCMDPLTKSGVKTQIKHYITDEIINHEEYNPETNCLIFGKEITHENSELNDDKNDEFELSVQSWKEKLHLSIDNNKSKIISSEEQDFGVIMHKVLEKINSNFDDAYNFIEFLKISSNVTKDQEKQLLKAINNLKNNKELQEVFSDNYTIYNEKEIVTKMGKTYRFDRLMVKDNRAIVIDYKTGVPKENHKKQLLDYVNILEKSGLVIEKAMLIYLPDLQIENLVS